MADKHQALMLSAERHIWNHPETGYREWKTHAYLKEQFEKLGYTITEAGTVPGFYTDIDTGRPGPTLLIMGEMDSLLIPDHPECDPATGFVHACGHHAQVAALLGIAAVLREPGALTDLFGRIRLMAVPAEELIEIAYREELRRQGVIHYYCGKVEFLYRGMMDGADLGLMVHTVVSTPGGQTYWIQNGQNGCIAKTIRYLGTAAHAGSAPHLGVNALYAATLGMHAVNSLRETFVDEDHIRFHPIVTSGGTAVSSIPNDVTMESYVRGANMPAILMQNRKINRALAASAAAIGCNVMLSDRPGYSPLNNSKAMMDIALSSVREVMGEQAIGSGGWSKGSTDLGDLGQVMPVLQPYCLGASGKGHSSNYKITDPYTAVVGSCKLQLVLLYALLSDGATQAKRVLAETKPAYASKEEFFRTIDHIFLDKEAVSYCDDGKVVLDFESDT